MMMVAAHEGRDVATCDVPGAYLHADMPDFVIMKFEGHVVDVLIQIDKNYENFVVIENGKRVIYVRLLKALYGCVKAALLWYELFSSTLVHMGFLLNPYDPCIANKMIKEKQCTIGWHVDDFMLTHDDTEVVSEVIRDINENFGPLSVVRGRKHTFLGMDIEFYENGTFSISMQDYLQEAIDDFGEDLRFTVKSAATKPIQCRQQQTC